MTRRLRLRSAAPAAARTPLDNDDLLALILLRLPPQPASLPRAGSVRTRWRRVATDPRFARSFRARRGAPPLLGVFLLSGRFVLVPTQDQDPPCRVPPTLTPLVSRAAGRGSIKWRFLGCRHGLAVTLTTRKDLASKAIITELGVFDPMTGDLSRIAATGRRRGLLTATVVAVPGAADRRSFRLVTLFSRHDRRAGVAASVYSSDSGAWADSVAALLTPSHVCLLHQQGTLVGDAIYWLLHGGHILRFELGRQSLAMVEQPTHAGDERWSPAMTGYGRRIMPAREGHLGLAILSGWSIQFWERETELSSAAAWVLCKTVELDRVLPLQFTEHMPPLRIIGFAEENNIIFISTHNGVYMTHIESMHFKKVPTMAGINCYIYPYSNF